MSIPKYFYEETLQVIVIINEIIIIDLFGFNYHDFVLVSINSHTHLRVAIMEDSKLLVDIIMASHEKNNIIGIKEKSNDHTNELCAITSCSFQTLF